MNVLIVDDSSAIRKILRRVIGQVGSGIETIYEAGDGLEALEMMKANSIGLVLSDVNMPNMNGLQFLRKLREEDHWKKIPVLMITTEGSQTTVLEAVELGASGYVRKPFTPEDIREKLASLCAA